jgi:hypothetical protein
MATLDVTETPATEVARGALQFHQLLDSIRDAAFNRRLAAVDLEVRPEDAEDPTDYMWVVARIEQDLANIANASEVHREGFIRALAAVLVADVSGYTMDEGFDAIAETARAFEGRVEPRPQLP